MRIESNYFLLIAIWSTLIWEMDTFLCLNQKLSYRKKEESGVRWQRSFFCRFKKKLTHNHSHVRWRKLKERLLVCNTPTRDKLSVDALWKLLWCVRKTHRISQRRISTFFSVLYTINIICCSLTQQRDFIFFSFFLLLSIAWETRRRKN